MRDLETASAALTIAETGHLVLTTGHAPSTYQAIERIIDLFPPHERSLAQTRLASLLIGISASPWTINTAVRTSSGLADPSIIECTAPTLHGAAGPCPVGLQGWGNQHGMFAGNEGMRLKTDGEIETS
jgi:hypothetical protein